MHIDNLTILFCLCAAATLLACAFAGAWATNRSTRGAGHFSFAFLAGALSCCLFAFVPARGPWSTFFNTVVGDAFVCMFLSLLHCGVRANLHISSHRRIVAALPILPCLLICIFTEGRDSMLARIIVLSLYGFAIRMLIGIDLVRYGKRKSQRALAWVMFVFATISLWQGIGTFLTGAPADYMRTDLIQSSVLFLYMTFVLATGLLLFLLLNDELVCKLEDEAERDFLTGTLNRRGIERALRAEIERSARREEPLTMGLIDIDHFKLINDTGGHAEGDRIVCGVASVALSCLRPYDYVGRFGGDEFVILLPGTDAQDSLVISERIRLGIALAMESVSVSIGISVKLPGDDSTEMMRRADDALYQAKQDGRDTIRLA